MVNQVGVNVNTASPALLAHVAGLNKTISENIVKYREENGALTSRQRLKRCLAWVTRPLSRQLVSCASQMRLILDNTGVHPESYKAVENLLELLAIDHLDEGAGKIEAGGYRRYGRKIGVGQETLKDIIADLLKPGRDLRDDFEAPVLRQDVLDVKDLVVGQELQGTVRNIVDFGAFVDIGVHEDGLVHISRMVKRKRDKNGRQQALPHPSEVLAVGEIVTVWVVEVDIKRNRIGLSLLKPNGSE